VDTNTRRRLLKSGKWRTWIIEQAREWKGTPYQHKGRVKHIGVDCGGLVYEVYNPLLGPFKPFPKDYPADWSLHQEFEMYMDFIKPYVTEVMVPKPAGLAMFKIGRNFGHAAIITEKKRFIHAWGRNQAGTVTESGIDFFRIGNEGKKREVRYFDVDEQWLLSHH